MASETGNLNSETDRFLAKRVHASHHHHHHHHGQWRRFPLFAATIAVIVATASVTIASDSPALAANRDSHFVKFSTHGAPQWFASMALYDSNGNVVQRWSTNRIVWRSGGGETWTYKETGGKLSVHLEGRTSAAGASIVDKIFSPANLSYCFLVKYDGNAEYTGDDSKSGTCNNK